ncbi:effector binding domain-containing protein [Vagococcus sp. BWB3-3]|uniref:Effector binding domain-containing protein n=1 Tax=Vagococcus allomyrinae TaxID=2794353 RepID=A0A940PAG1_9ENTE|nr:effector binding domain-containing protein [Vagococcus allomyrinae]MBP1039831.1 effector binding domain-containing protein [Vagococcus allomyrinae]
MKLNELASVRTNNVNDPEMTTKIQGVWGEAQAKLTQKMPLYGVYHAYESDYKGDYTLSIACEAGEEGAFLMIDDRAMYQVFPVDTSQERAVYQTWQRIWALEEQGDLSRSYKFDYEKYATDGSIEIFLGIHS